MLKIRLSHRSIKPPCPGIKSPESLTPAVRFISDALRSPSCPSKLRRSPMKTACPQDSVTFKRITPSRKPTKVPTTNPPIIPSTVFRGLTGVPSLCLPKATPTRYAPVSPHQIVPINKKMRCRPTDSAFRSKIR